MNLYAFPPLIVDILLTAIGLFVLLQNKSSKLNIIFSLFSFSMSVWLFGYTNMYFSKDATVALHWARLGFIGIIFVPVFAYHFIISFLCLKRKIVLPVIYFLTIPSLIFSQSNYIYSGIKEHFWGFYPTAGKFYIVFLLMFAILFTRGVLLLVFQFKKEIGIKRKQIKYVCLAFGLGTFGLVDYIIKFPVGEIYPFGYLCALLFDSLIAFAILRYRLLDISVAITRASIFIFVYLFVLGTPFVLGYKYGSWQVATWVTVFLATAGPFIFISLSQRAEARLLAQKRSRQEKLRVLSSFMMRFSRLKLLTNLIVHNTLKILELKHAALYLLASGPNETRQFNLVSSYGIPQKQDLPLDISLDSALAKELTNSKTAVELERLRHKITSVNNHAVLLQLERELSALNAHIVIPTFLRFNLMGFLMLGESRNNEDFTREDINTLQVLSNQAALAIENASFWEKEEDKLFTVSREQAVTDVSFGAGHQFNNRLCAISMTCDGILDMLRERSVSEISDQEAKRILQQAAPKLKKISEECQYGGEITKGIMSLTGTTPPTFEEFNPASIINSSLELVEMKHSQDKIEGKKPVVDISCHLDQDLPRVFGSDAQIRDCVFNLVDNSFDAVYEKIAQIRLKNPKLNWPENSSYIPHIELKTFTKDNQLIISITDNGIGVKEEDKRRIFAGYYTSKPTGLQAYGKGGHGIGLFVVKKFILAHKGKIYFSSEYGQGTTFTIELPLLRPKDNKKDA